MLADWWRAYAARLAGRGSSRRPTTSRTMRTMRCGSRRAAPRTARRACLLAGPAGRRDDARIAVRAAAPPRRAHDGELVFFTIPAAVRAGRGAGAPAGRHAVHRDAGRVAVPARRLRRLGRLLHRHDRVEPRASGQRAHRRLLREPARVAHRAARLRHVRRAGRARARHRRRRAAASGGVVRPGGRAGRRRARCRAQPAVPGQLRAAGHERRGARRRRAGDAGRDAGDDGARRPVSLRAVRPDAVRRADVRRRALLHGVPHRSVRGRRYRAAVAHLCAVPRRADRAAGRAVRHARARRRGLARRAARLAEPAARAAAARLDRRGDRRARAAASGPHGDPPRRRDARLPRAELAREPAGGPLARSRRVAGRPSACASSRARS